MRLTFTFTEYHESPEREKIWILSADVDKQWTTGHDWQDEFYAYTANIQSVYTDNGPLLISDIPAELLTEMEKAAIQWVFDDRESLPEMAIEKQTTGTKLLAFVSGYLRQTGASSECFNALLGFCNTPQTTT